MIALKRAYEEWEEADGHRVLVDRLWPRGLRKDDAHLDAWRKELAPSDDLRTWFAHDVEHWAEFRRRYQTELRSQAARDAIDELAKRARRGKITLVYAARDESHNNAVVLRDLIARAAKTSVSTRRATPKGR
jgi:uncharacterized protein YeaO (DUF488 family)